MTNLARHLRDLCEAELRAWGVTYEFGNGGKHPFVRIIGPGGRWAKVPISASPSDQRAVRNHRALLRRTCRSLGAVESVISSTSQS
jgi:hypothetical protein